MNAIMSPKGRTVKAFGGKGNCGEENRASNGN